MDDKHSCLSLSRNSLESLLLVLLVVVDDEVQQAQEHRFLPEVVQKTGVVCLDLLQQIFLIEYLLEGDLVCRLFEQGFYAARILECKSAMLPCDLSATAPRGSRL